MVGARISLEEIKLMDKLRLATGPLPPHAWQIVKLKKRQQAVNTTLLEEIVIFIHRMLLQAVGITIPNVLCLVKNQV